MYENFRVLGEVLPRKFRRWVEEKFMVKDPGVGKI